MLASTKTALRPCWNAHCRCNDSVEPGVANPCGFSPPRREADTPGFWGWLASVLPSSGGASQHPPTSGHSRDNFSCASLVSSPSERLYAALGNPCTLEMGWRPKGDNVVWKGRRPPISRPAISQGVTGAGISWRRLRNRPRSIAWRSCLCSWLGWGPSGGVSMSQSPSQPGQTAAALDVNAFGRTGAVEIASARPTRDIGDSFQLPDGPVIKV